MALKLLVMIRVRRRKGISLVEVLFATFLALACALIVVATMPMATASRMKTDQRLKAMNLLQKELESIKAAGYPNITAQGLFDRALVDTITPVATNVYSFTSVDNAAFDNPAQILPSGVGRVTIEQVDIELKRVTVTVNWTDRGRARTMSLGTLIANL